MCACLTFCLIYLNINCINGTHKVFKRLIHLDLKRQGKFKRKRGLYTLNLPWTQSRLRKLHTWKFGIFIIAKGKAKSSENENQEPQKIFCREQVWALIKQLAVWTQRFQNHYKLMTAMSLPLSSFSKRKYPLHFPYTCHFILVCGGHNTLNLVTYIFKSIETSPENQPPHLRLLIHMKMFWIWAWWLLR